MPIYGAHVIGCAPLSAPHALARPSAAETTFSTSPTIDAPILRGDQQSLCARWLAEHGGNVRIYQSHGGSGAQARAVTYGLEADS